MLKVKCWDYYYYFKTLLPTGTGDTDSSLPFAALKVFNVPSNLSHSMKAAEFFFVQRLGFFLFLNRKCVHFFSFKISQKRAKAGG